jgi:hypothetical protein
MDRSKLVVLLVAGVMLPLMLLTQPTSPLVKVAIGVAMVVAGVVAVMPLWRNSRKYVVVSLTTAFVVVALGFAALIL